MFYEYILNDFVGLKGPFINYVTLRGGEGSSQRDTL